MNADIIRELSETFDVAVSVIEEGSSVVASLGGIFFTSSNMPSDPLNAVSGYGRCEETAKNNLAQQLQTALNSNKLYVYNEEAKKAAPVSP